MDLSILKSLQDARVTAELLQEKIAEAIDAKLLQPGERMPSTRDIAQFVGASRTTVMKAFDALIARGYLATRHGSGTWVAGRNHQGSAHSEQTTSGTREQNPGQWSPRYTSFARSVSMMGAEMQGSADFEEINWGSTGAELLPLRQWQKTLAGVAAKIGEMPFDHNSEVFGYRPLRQAIAGFLRRTKGIICSPNQIVVDSGVQNVLSPIFHLLVNEGDMAICEDPGFYGAREQFEGAGAHVIPAAVDEEGLIVDALPDQDQPNPTIKWLYIASSCQEPTGVSLSAGRRQQLIDWCKKHGTVIIEDDWDSDFHYRGSSQPSLFALDKSQSVIYFYSFWRLLYPLCSVSILVLPESLVPLVESYKSVWNRQFTLMEHYVLAELLDNGQIEKQIRSLWRNYKKQRELLLYALTRCFQNKIKVVLSSTGMHLVARFDATLAGETIERSAQEARLPLASTRPFYLQAAWPNEYMIRFAAMPAQEIEARVEQFAAQLLISQQ